MAAERSSACPRCGDRNDIKFSPELIADLAAHVPIDPALRSDELVYEKRLLTCSRCDALREEVLCAYCGCFVLFRARSAKGYCPSPEKDKWRQI
jgi:hypothetical protein